jgi:hypothetical protein
MRRALIAVLLLGGCTEVESPIPGLLFDHVAVGGDHSCALTATGDLYCWGSGADGRLGTGSHESTFRPRPVDPTIAFATVTAGREHTCGIDRSEEAYCWGFNAWGQLGVSDRGERDRPSPIPDDRLWQELSAGWYHTCGITTGGELLCWGNNDAGQLGQGTLEQVSWPRQVAGELRFTATTVTGGGYHTCALDVDGRAYCWGRNDQGQLGDGTTERRLRPTPALTERRFVEISAGQAHTCARTESGDVYCWGSNAHGEIGHNAFSRPGVAGSVVPGIVARREVYVWVRAGAEFSCAIDDREIGYCWGDATYGQVGRATRNDWPKPADIPGPLFRAIAAGAGSHACGVSDDRATVYCWGTGPEGELGNPARTFSAVPLPVIFSN